MPRKANPADWETSTGALLQRAATNWPDREALVIGPRRMRYRELDEQARGFAARLHNMGVRSGTHVALLGPNSPSWAVAYFALGLLGAVMVPLNPRFSPRELRYSLRKSRCELLVAQQGFASLLEANPATDAGDVPPVLPLGIAEYGTGADPFAGLAGPARGFRPAPVDPGALAVIMFTSGSTAFPKGCMLAHRGLIRNGFLHDARLHLTDQDRWFGPTPFFHASGCVWGILSVVCVGATLVSCEHFDTEESLSILERERCTYQHGIETIYVRQLEAIKRHHYDLSSLKKSTSTGPRSLLVRIRDEMGVDFIMSKWGATEGYGNLSLCDIDDPVERRLDSHGRLYPEFAYRIADPESPEHALPEGQEGEIQVRGPAMLGYFDDPEATRACILNDGWLRTGDQGRLDGDFLYYTNRIKDMLKIGGENVAASEIEDVLIQFPGVLNVAVVGRPDPEWGEIAVAFVELAGALRPTEAALVEHCGRMLSRIKVPRRIVFMEEFPLTGSGKVDKKRLLVD